MARFSGTAANFLSDCGLFLSDYLRFSRGISVFKRGKLGNCVYKNWHTLVKHTKNDKILKSKVLAAV